MKGVVKVVDQRAIKLRSGNTEPGFLKTQTDPFNVHKFILRGTAGYHRFIVDGNPMHDEKSHYRDM